MGNAFLGYYAASDELTELYGKAARVGPQRGFRGPVMQDGLELQPADFEPRWPWYWSASVLLALGGLSAWILNKRVKNLDRLR